jgi:hypothetical protein
VDSRNLWRIFKTIPPTGVAGWRNADEARRRLAVEVWRGRRRLEWVVAGLAVAGAVVLALPPTHWPFQAAAAGRDTSLWQLLLTDRVTLGFVRLSVVLVSLFVIASVAALFTAGRWLRGIGSAGVSADDRGMDEAVAEIARLNERVRQLTEERDTLIDAAQERAERAVKAAGHGEEDTA